MVNQVVLVGRLVRRPELKLTEAGKKMAVMTLAVPRNYKNVDGEYETDYFDCTLWTSIAENTNEYCDTGDMLGVKGRLQTRIIEASDGTKKKKTEIVAEKITFLTSQASKKNKKSIEAVETNDLKEESQD